MRYVCGCCGKAACDDDTCPGCARQRRDERGVPPRRDEDFTDVEAEESGL